MINNPSLLRSTSLENGRLAFTLVELIVVITILAILWTIAFISLQWYSRDARDSVRTTDLASISKQLELMIVKAWIVYIPENKVDITASGIIISYQWEIWQDTLNKLRVNNGGLDPVDQSPYIYTTTKNLKQYELMWFLENWNTAYNNTISQTYAALNLTNRFPVVKWDSIWIFLNPITKEPINQTWTWIDIVNTTINYTSYLDNSTSWIITGTWWSLYKILSKRQVFKSCLEIKNKYKSWSPDWVYKINPTWTLLFDVYCDMTTDWWGWTRVLDYNWQALSVTLNDKDWYQDKYNYSYLYSFKDIKNSNWKYEFLVRWYNWTSSKWLQFTQKNSYDQNPNNNDFKEIAWDFTFLYPVTNWKWLSAWHYWNTNMKNLNVCNLKMSYWSTNGNNNWYTCLIDNQFGAWWTWPWHISINPMTNANNRVLIYQR